MWTVSIIGHPINMAIELVLVKYFIRFMCKITLNSKQPQQCRGFTVFFTIYCHQKPTKPVVQLHNYKVFLWVELFKEIVLTSPNSFIFHTTEKVSLSSAGLRLHNCSHRIRGNIGTTWIMKNFIINIAPPKTELN